MIARVHLIVDACYVSFLIDHKAHAIRVGCVAVVAGAISERRRAVEIAEQGEFEFISLRESSVDIGRVEAHADHLNIVFIEVILMIAEPTTFGCSTGSISLGKEPKHYSAPAQCGQRYSRALVRLQRKLRGRIPSLHHSFFLQASIQRRAQPDEHCAARWIVGLDAKGAFQLLDGT